MDHIDLSATDTPPPRAAEEGDEADCPRSFLAALIATAPIAPVAAALMTVAAYSGSAGLSPLWGEAVPLWAQLASHPLVVSVATLLAAWLLLSLPYFLLGFTAANRANASSYYGLWDRLRQLQAQCAQLCPDPGPGGGCRYPDSPLKSSAADEACAHREAIRRALRSGGPRWTLGSGYIALWERTDRAEEALIDVKPREAAIADAWYDFMRADSSSINNRDELRTRIDAAARCLRALEVPASRQQHPGPAGNAADGGVAVEEGTPAAVVAQRAASANGEQVVDAREATGSPVPFQGAVAAAAAQPGMQLKMDLPRSETEARTILRQVRRSINNYRSERWAGLVRARNNLALAMALTSVFVYTILWLAIIDGASAATIGAATAFFLAGATVGLFNQCYNDSRTATVVDDYGLAGARLLVTPLISGVAAVAGVFLVSMLSISQLQVQSNGPSNTSLIDFFNLQDHPFSLIVAATFGLTPGLLVDRLKEQAEQYKQDLQSSKAAGTSANQ